MTPDIHAILTEVAAGITYPSESDEPFEVLDSRPTFFISDLAPAQPVQEQSLDDFFAPLLDYDERFIELREVLERHLTHLTVYRVGSRRVAVYLVGQTPAGSWTGLKTLSIET